MRGAGFDRAVWPFALALAIAIAVGVALPFDGLFGQDAFAYFRFARAIWPHFVTGAPLPELFWPRGFPAAVAAWLPITGGRPLAGQIVSALACAWAAAAAYLLIAELDRRRGDGEAIDATARVVAGLCLGASGASLRSSEVVMADGLAMGLAATGLWCAARFLRGRHGPWLVACAVAVAGGAATRWQVGLLAIPLGAAVLLAGRPPVGSRFRLWCLVAVVAGLLVLVPQLVVARAVPHSLAHHEWLQSWSPLNALRREFENREGHVRYRFPVAVFYLARIGWPDALFPTIALLAAVGAWSLIGARRGVEIALLIGWPFVNWAFISGIPYENPRFLWPTFPAIAGLAGIGYRSVRGRLAARGRSVLAGLMALSIAAGLALGAREHARTVTRKNADRAVVDWIDAQVPAGATLLMSGGTLMSEYYGTTRVRDTYLLTPDDLPPLLAREGACFYLEDTVDVAGSQVGRSPQLLFEALRRDPGLTPLASRGPLVLYRVGQP